MEIDQLIKKLENKKEKLEEQIEEIDLILDSIEQQTKIKDFEK